MMNTARHLKSLRKQRSASQIASARWASSLLLCCGQLEDIAVSAYLKRNFRNLAVAFGCTGGQHRSVYFAERLGRHLRERFPGVGVHVRHREQDRWARLTEEDAGEGVPVSEPAQATSSAGTARVVEATTSPRVSGDGAESSPRVSGDGAAVSSPPVSGDGASERVASLATLGADEPDGG